MKNQFILLLLLSMANSLCGQQTILTPSLKFGKPSTEELALTVFTPDTSAVAIVLYRTGTTKYTYNLNQFGLFTEISTKIKILKPEGLQYANVTLPYYVPEKSPEKKDNITELEAYSYNIENGKTVKKSTGKEFIVRERVNDKYMQLKFSIPGARVGSVIEYKYRVTSDFYQHIENWTIQDEIPVLYNEYDIDIPRIFDFNAEGRGAEHIAVDAKEGSIHISVRDDDTGIAQVKRDVIINTLHSNFKSRNLPALRQDESHLWCPDDHKIQISFELKGTQFPGSPYKPYTQSWEDIDAVLLKDETFGDLLHLPNPYREEMKTLNLTALNREQRISSLMQLLNRKLAWNGEYGIFCPNLSKSITKGSGSSAELNFVLLSMFREAGLKAYPVVLSRRNRGMLPVTYPSIQKLNAWIIAVEMEGQKWAFIDSSMGANTQLNALPVNLMSPKARIIAPSVKDKWVDLSKIGTNQTSIQVEGIIHPDATVTGVRDTEYTGQAAAQYRRNYRAAADSVAFLEKQGADIGCQISEFRTEGLHESGNLIKETFTFSKQSGYDADNFLYVNPMVFTHITQNPFTQAERQLPVEFHYPYTMRILTTLTLPEGYQVEEIPQAATISLGEKDLTCRYTIREQGNKLICTYQFSQTCIDIPASAYQDLKLIWESLAQKNNEWIVLKKTL